MLSSPVDLLPFLLFVTTSAVADSAVGHAVDGVLPGAGLSSQPVKIILCHEIPNGNRKEFNLWKNCKYERNIIGNLKYFIMLDFSDASEKEITTFFGKAKEKFTLSAGIRLFHNNNVQNLKLGNLKKIEIHQDIWRKLFDIVGNYNLQSIEAPNLDEISIKNTQKHNSIFVNNPILNMNGFLQNWTINEEKAQRLNLTKFGECLFISRQSKRRFVDNIPSDDKLDRCMTIIGDLHLENRRLSHHIKIKNGCLRLINVDFGEYWFLPIGKGFINCTDGTQSKLIDNRKLCGRSMRELVDYIQNETVLDHRTVMWDFLEAADVKFEIRLDEESCGVNCGFEQVRDYYLCRSIVSDISFIDISVWFKYKGFAQKIDFLQSSTATLKIGTTDLSVLKMSNLESVKHLRILDNRLLTKIELPSLKEVGILDISGNNKLTLSELAKAFENIDMISGESHVECNPDGIITDLRKMKLCTHVIGDLTLADMNYVNESLFTVRELKGCFTVRNTKLTSLHFLEKIKLSDCIGEHLIKDNPNLCDKGYFIGKNNVRKENNRVIGCPCILDDLAKTATTSSNCNVTHVYKDFDCNLYTAVHLIEARGILIVKNCPKMDVAFPKLEKIVVDYSGEVPLVIRKSSELPSVEFLKRLKMESEGTTFNTIQFAIHSEMSIDEYLQYKYALGSMNAVLQEPITSKETCYSHLNTITNDCKIFEGDLVVRNDELNRTTSIETITGCLIVQHGSQLNFLNELKHVGKSCLYGDKDKYPWSPSQGFLKTEISKMKEDYCPPRAERERLSNVLQLTVFELSGKDPSCSKSCKDKSARSCDDFHGNLILEPDDHVTNLEIIHGSLIIGGTQKEQLEFPKLTQIISPTAPALRVHDNPELRSLLMPKLINITAKDNGKELIVITKNPKLDNLDDFIPENIRGSCHNETDTICYVNNFEEEKKDAKKDKAWERDIIILAIVLAVIFGVPVAYHLLTFEEKEAEREKRQRRQKERRRRMRMVGVDSIRKDDESSTRTAIASSPPSRVAPSLVSTVQTSNKSASLLSSSKKSTS